MKVAIIIDNEETRKSLHQYLLDDKRIFRKVYAFNSIDTFISDAYMLTDVDVIMLDMHLSAGIPAIEGLGIIEETPFLKKAKILLMTSVADTNYNVFKWLCMYPSSYIDKEMSFYNIKESIVSVAANGALLVPVITKRGSSFRQEGASEYAAAPLTARENQVVEYVIARESEEMIAQRLSICERLVRRYVRNAFHKIRLNTQITLPVQQSDPVSLDLYKRVG